jgi:hypothetical protein
MNHFWSTSLYGLSILKLLGWHIPEKFWLHQIGSLFEAPFIWKILGKKTSHQFFDNNHPLSIKISSNQTDPTLFLLNLDLARGHSVLLADVIEFLQSLDVERKLKITNVNLRRSLLADIKSNKLLEFKPGLPSLVSSLVFIQRETGQIIRYQ